MGEIADDMIDGTVCSDCGMFFNAKGESYTHGYPVLCWDCWDDWKPSERRDAHVRRALVPTH